MMALGRRASISATGIAAGTISEYTWHSRTRRAMSWAYWAPKSTTSTVSGAPSSPTGERTAASLVALDRGIGPRAVGRGRLADPDPGDAPPVELGHGQLAAGHLDRLALAGQVAERGEQVARHGLVRALGELDPGLLGEVVQVEQAVDLQFAAVQLPGVVLLDVVLVVDLADQLLDEILQRDDASGAAVLVEHDGQVRVLAPHFRQGGQHGLAGRQELHRPAHLPDPLRAAARAGAEQVPG